MGRELKCPEASAQCLALFIVEKLEKRASFRQSIRFREKQTRDIKTTLGIRIQISGRLGGAEIARTEWTRKGRVPLHTICANLDYSFNTAHTIYGLLGIKVWVFH